MGIIPNVESEQLMADVEYKGKVPSEPKVNVSGIPKSEYDATAGGAPSSSKGSGIEGNLKAHWPMYTVILGVATIGVIIWSNWRNSSSSSSVDTGSTGGTTTSSYPDQVYGSQLDADYQQMMQLQNQTNSLLQTILNKPTTTTGSSDGPGGTLSSSNPGFNLPKGGRLIGITDTNSTLSSLAKYAHWTPQQVFNYGNNAQMFTNEGIGIGDINKKIKKGTVLAI